MILDLIDSLSKENWDGICNVIETTGKAAGAVLAGYAAVEGAKALANRGKKEESINTDSITKTDIEKLIEAKIAEAASRSDDLVEAFAQGKVSKDLVNAINNK